MSVVVAVIVSAALAALIWWGLHRLEQRAQLGVSLYVLVGPLGALVLGLVAVVIAESTGGSVVAFFSSAAVLNAPVTAWVFRGLVRSARGRHGG